MTDFSSLAELAVVSVRLMPAILLSCLLISKYRKMLQQLQDDTMLARRYGCCPAPRIRNHLPGGIDRLREIFDADADSRLMRLFQFHFDRTGHTLDHVFLGTRAFGTIHPANVDAILSTNFKDWSFGPRRAITYPMFGDGIFTQEGDAWRDSRETLRPHFHHKNYADLQLIKGPVDDFLQILPHDGMVDLQPLFSRLTLDVTTAFLFGESVQSLKSPDSVGEQDFAEAFNTAQKYVVMRFRLLDLYWLIDGPNFRTACGIVNSFADRLIDRSASRKETSIIQKLRKTATRDAVRGQAVNIIAAGRDTTSCLLSWTFFLLVRHPQSLEKLKIEILTSSSRVSDPDRDSLQGLKYLQSVIKETLRLYPPVPVNVRTARTTTILPTGGGPGKDKPILVPKGTDVAFSSYVMHRRTEFFGPDAESFRPERWLEGTPQDYYTFSKGPRRCMGENFATTITGYFIYRYILERDIELPKTESVEPLGQEGQNISLVLSSSNGCKIKTTKRGSVLDVVN